MAIFADLYLQFAKALGVDTITTNQNIVERLIHDKKFFQKCIFM